VNPDEGLIGRVAQGTRDLGIENPYLLAHLYAKLATYALDQGQHQLFANLLGEATDLTEPGSSIQRALRVTGANLLGWPLEQQDFERPTDVDRLVDYDWIDDRALAGAREELQALLKSRSASPWSWTIGGGRTPADQAIAAERQVTWAGALWKRDGIRQQLAAHLLNDPSRDGYATFYALAMWLLSGGRDTGAILSFAEPRFDATTADRLIEALESQAFILRVRDTVLPETALELWDLLSADTVDRLLTLYVPKPGQNPLDTAVRHLWGRVSLTEPKLWRKHFDGLDQPRQIAVLEALPPLTVEKLPRKVAKPIAVAADRERATLSLQARAANVMLHHRLDEAVSAVDTADAFVVAEIALRVPDALTPSDYEEAERGLREKCKAEVESARQGSMSFGGPTPIRLLSLVAQARGKVDRSTVALLIDLAFDVTLPGDSRLNALLALSGLSHAGLLSRKRLEQIRDVPDQVAASFFMNVSADLLHAARLSVRSTQLDDKEQIALFTLSRNPDVRVRQFVCETAGRFLAVKQSPSVEAALLAALFDPDETVLNAGLGALETAKLTQLSEDAVVDRLERLYLSYGREVRATTVRAARKLASVRPDDSRLTRIVHTGTGDRSWLVRDAAFGGAE
jgi:hypothetical protein